MKTPVTRLELHEALARLLDAADDRINNLENDESFGPAVEGGNRRYAEASKNAERILKLLKEESK